MVGREWGVSDIGGDVGTFSVTLNHSPGEDHWAVDSNVAIEVSVRTAVEVRINTGVRVATARIDGSVDGSTAVSEAHGVARR